MKNPDKKMRKIKLKSIIFIIIIYIGFCYSFYYCMKGNEKINNEEFIKLLLSGSDYTYLNDYKGVNLINSTMKMILKIDIKEPESILNGTIFKKDDEEKVSGTSINLEYRDDYSNMDELKEISSYIEDPSEVVIEEPIVYIYNSHQLENYSNENLEIYGITPNVLMASYLLKEKLNDLNIPTIVEDTNMSEMLSINGWDHSSSYKASRLLIMSKMSEYSSIKYFIDIHRDSVSRDISTVVIGKKSYAKILFVIGQDYDGWEENNEVALKINSIANEMYPNISRGILKKTGASVNGVYNQDLSSRSILIELGGVENTIEEVFNTTIALSNIISKYIEGDN